MIYMFQLNGLKQLCVSLTLNWTHGVQSLGKHLKREIRFLKKLRQHCKIRFYYVLSDYSQASMVIHVDD